MTSAPPILLALMLLAGQQVSAAETVVIAAENDWPPYSALKPDRSGPEGFSVDLVREAFKTQGIKVQYQVLPFSRSLHDAEFGKVVGCFNATMTDSNRDTYCWHPTPMFKESLLIFGPRTSPRENLTIKDLEGHSVGTTIGYTSDSFTKNIRIKHNRATSDENLIRMLALGRVDYILLNGMPGYQRINSEPKLKGKIKKVGTISIDGFWLAFSKRHPEGERQCRAFEQGLQILHRNGQYKAMENQFRKRIGL